MNEGVKTVSKTNLTQPVVNGHPPVNSAPAEDPAPKTTGFNWDDMRLPRDFADHLVTRRTAVTVAVSKPDRQAWIFLHPSSEWRIRMPLLTDKINRRNYAVVPAIVPELTDDLVPKLLVTYATRQGSLALWPIRLADESGRLDSYNESALAIVGAHSGKWIRVMLDQGAGAYYIIETEDPNLPEPKWPETGLKGLLDLAFRGRVIDSLEHPAVAALRRAEL